MADAYGLLQFRRRRSTTRMSAQRDRLTLVYLVYALVLALAASQHEEDFGTLRYLLYIVPVSLVALIRPMVLLRSIDLPISLIIVMTYVSCCWFLYQGDYSAVMRIGLFGLSTWWFCASTVRLRDQDVYLLYVGAIALGAIIWLSTDFNEWGLIPGTTSASLGIWRVSFFSNIAYTGFFSLFVIIIAFRNQAARLAAGPVLFIALYFAAFSFVRTVLISVVLYLLGMWILRRMKQPWQLFLVALTLAVLTNLAVAYSASLIGSLQNIPIISRLFLRGETALSEFEIYQQLYRPWLWGQHWSLAWDSPFWMGWGSIPFVHMVKNSIFQYGLETGDTVSLLTRLLYQNGLIGFLYWAFMLACLWRLSKRGDWWGCALFPVVASAMLQWGAIFHPGDPMALLYVGLLAKGSDFIIWSNSPRYCDSAAETQMFSTGQAR
jgi:hypothetical protein